MQRAVSMLEESGDPNRVFFTAARYKTRSALSREAGAVFLDSRKLPGTIATLPAAMRLALEMASHEDSERRALEGELHVLEAAWRDADEIAKISDDLFLPSGVQRALARLKGSTKGE